MTIRAMLHSDLAIHPGELLGEELEARGLSQQQLATDIGRPAEIIDEIVRGQHPITAAIAIELEEAFQGPSADYWLGLQTEYDLTVARAQHAQRSTT